jgi:hypothetical protein
MSITEIDTRQVSWKKKEKRRQHGVGGAFQKTECP